MAPSTQEKAVAQGAMVGKILGGEIEGVGPLLDRSRPPLHASWSGPLGQRDDPATARPLVYPYSNAFILLYPRAMRD